MVPFAGFEMPVRYAGDNLEHMGVRQQVGMFDVSHMGEFLFRGPHAFDLLQQCCSNNIKKLEVGMAQYNCIPTHQGGIVDDCIVYRIEEDLYMVVANAANITKDWTWFMANNTVHAQMEDISDQTALLAVSGPLALETMQKLVDIDIDNIPFYRFAMGNVAGVDRVLISATGYTGERTFELYLRQDQAPHLWDAILEAGQPHGIQPCGLGARDTLRLEAGLHLYGNDMDESTTPLEAGLGWITKLKKGPFNGRDVLQQQKDAGLQRRLIAFHTLERGIPRPGHTLYDGDEAIGVVTSGTFSPSLRNGIGFGYVPLGYKEPGSQFSVGIRNKRISCEVVKTPFVDNTSLQLWLQARRAQKSH